MKIVYFASLRRKIGLAEEQVAPPAAIDRVDRLVAWLAAQSPTRHEALTGTIGLMVAINQDYAAMDSPIKEDDEIAFFPPVTGG